MSDMIYQVEDTPKTRDIIAGVVQQILGSLAATIMVPILIGLNDHISTAVLGCGLGTLAYLIITKRKSPVLLSSNFAFVGALVLAYQGYGFLGIVLGGVFTGLVYVILSIVVKFSGTRWIDKLFPPVIIGPVVALIGLTLSTSAVADLVSASGYIQGDPTSVSPYNLVALFCGLVAFIVVVICSVQNRRKYIQTAPFLFGAIAGYVTAGIFSIFGYCFDIPYLRIIDISPLIDNFKNLSIKSFLDYPRFSLLEGINELTTGTAKLTPLGVLEIAIAFVPISLVSFSEHIADHKNLSSIINRDLLNGEPGLSRTLMGDGVGTIVGTAFGICPNTTYGEAVGCIAITKNASTITIIFTAFAMIGLSFFTPLIALFRTIPSCVIGGLCLVLFGYIAVSGFKMIKNVNLDKNKNLFTLSVILIAGIGGLCLQIPYQFELEPETTIYVVSKAVTVTSIAFALILGIITYFISSSIEKRNKKEDHEKVE